jgi:prepilin-type processing-associated H-X9-DG protein/prepilin-type N-terminal cleavage/methylation domain-containing protein
MSGPTRSARRPGQICKPTGSHAFTLFELLAVLIIIAILAALLLPALSRAKTKADGLTCLGQLRQLQLCFHLYADDNNDILPPNNAIDDFSAGNPVDNGASWCAGSARLDTTTTNIERGCLFKYNRSMAIYHCPADRSKVMTYAGKTSAQLRTRSYAMSQSVNGFPEQYAAELDEPTPSFKKSTQILDPGPTKLLVFLDVHEDEIGDSRFGIPTKDSADYLSNWDDLPANRHGQGCNLSFADGHAEQWKWVCPKTVTIGPGETGQAVVSGEVTDYLRVESGVRQSGD